MTGDVRTFDYRNGELFCEDVPVRGIVESCGTPTYVYSARAFHERYEAIAGAFSEWNPLVCYSIKCCGNLSILSLLARAGAGFDIVSGGELYRALRAGADPASIVFAGVGKTEEEIEYALKQGILLFDVESRPELELIDAVARRLGVRARAAIRMNPDVAAGERTHAKTTTGKWDTKFGIGMRETESLFTETASWGGVDVLGIHLHLGSPIYSVKPYQEALERVVGVVERIRAAGHPVDYINLGGGYCISYTGEEQIGPKEYAEGVQSYLEKLGCAVIIEPGRYIAGNSGILVSRVIYRKENEYGKRFVICDAAMNDLIRPTLYDAFQRVWPVVSPGGMPAVLEPGDRTCDGFETELADVVGPVCETGDFLAKDRPLPPVAAGELIAVFGAGAYGFAMSSNYNARPRAAEVLVDGSSWRVVRRRETWQDLVAPEEECM